MKRSGETCCASEAPAATGSACDSAAASIPSNPEHGSNKDTIASAGADPLNSTQSTRINPAPSSWPLSYESGAPKSDTVTAIDTVKTAATPAARQQQQRQGGGSQITGPLFSFGAIADVQYADRDDGWNYYKTHRRFYRGGLRQLRKAVDVWLREESHSFALQLGDIMDGSSNGCEKSLKRLTVEIKRLSDELPLGVLNSLGNHELYNFPKQRWAQEVDCSSRAKAAIARPSCGTHTNNSSTSGNDGSNSKKDERFFYSFCPDQSHRFIALDTYDMNAIRGEGGRGRWNGDETPPPHPATLKMLSERNPNEDKNDDDGIEGLDKRFVMYNGGIGTEQLTWLEGQLRDASEAGQRVIAFGHVPIYPSEDFCGCLLWNYKEVLKVMDKFDCVSAVLSGHRHQETYFRNAKGVHHVSFAAALEAPPDQEAFASIDVYSDRLELRGHGLVETRTLLLAEIS